jgi:hypothetical protein
MPVTEQDNAAAYGKIIAKAWRDPAFKAKLLADPHAALKDAGISVPPGVTVKVVENTGTHVHIVLPPKPTRLSDEELDKVSAGLSPESWASMELPPEGAESFDRLPFLAFPPIMNDLPPFPIDDKSKD